VHRCPSSSCGANPHVDLVPHHGVLPFRQREVIDELSAAKKAPAFSKVSFQSVIQAAPVINPAAVS
jgi:hypothetical protein